MPPKPKETTWELTAWEPTAWELTAWELTAWERRPGTGPRMGNDEMAEPASRAYGRKTDQQRAGSLGLIRDAFETTPALLDSEVRGRFDASERDSFSET